MSYAGSKSLYVCFFRSDKIFRECITCANEAKIKSQLEAALIRKVWDKSVNIRDKIGVALIYFKNGYSQS